LFGIGCGPGLWDQAERIEGALEQYYADKRCCQSAEQRLQIKPPPMTIVAEPGLCYEGCQYSR
jgi:hypothetical protein